MAPTLQTTPELFNRVYRVNLRGLACASKPVAARMIEQGGGGKIVNIASSTPSIPRWWGWRVRRL